MIRDALEFVRLRQSDDPDEYRRAARESADVSVWHDILDRFPEMASWVALNKTIPEEVIRRLYSLGDGNVRFTLAQKRRTPVDILLNMCKDEDSVRLAVARNARLSREGLLMLVADEWDEVAAVAQSRLSAERHGG